MSTSDIISIYDRSSKITAITASFEARQKSQIIGLVGSSFSFVVHSLFKKSELPFLLLCNTKEEAAYYLNDLEQL
ncbi:MAG: Transcription-repair coupling factor, partial [Bacteroidota bacterium]